MPIMSPTEINKASTSKSSIERYDDLGNVEVVRGLTNYMDADNKVADRSVPKGHDSKFNPLYKIVFNDNDARALTDEGFAESREDNEPTIENLLKPDNFIQQSYDMSDFLFCRDADLVSGYHMLTLRRMPYPVDDCLTWAKTKAPQHDIGRLVTYTTSEINKISSIMSMSFGLRWKEMTADFWTPEVVGSQWGADGLLGQLFKLTNPGYLATQDAFKNSVNVDPHYDSNKVYGPINTITSTHIRDRGLNFDQNISLEFNYVLRSYDGVNPKAAFIDLLSHVLAVTTNDATFWGGANKWVGIPQTAHHKYMSYESARTQAGDFEANVNYYKSQLSSVAGGNTAQTILNAARMLLNGLGAFAFDKVLKVLGRPSIVLANSLLSGEAVGNWHLTVGNPFRPIASIGNLILTSTTLTLGDDLGHDGFPNSMKVTCDLKHAKPRSRPEIEMMFNAGKSRTYFQPIAKDLGTRMEKSTAYRNKTQLVLDNLTSEVYSYFTKGDTNKDPQKSQRDSDFFTLKNKK